MEEHDGRAAGALASSQLGQASWYGSDPNWGRIAAATGHGKAGVDFEKMELFYGGVGVLKDGQPLLRNEDKWKEVVSNKQFSIRLNLNLGQGPCTLLTSDLSEAYVDFNKSE